MLILIACEFSGVVRRACGNEFISFPAKIRMKDGSDLELWFVCEEE